ncbi:hypothetical protein CesoFtcFv8_016428 [Champsocephalus esox]|uniref:Uncharacterized protein n=1 Tax=Champsocephalus esox TaxID=159716 RepID=A0AAN8BMM7_9TELE|nr:hypothetical protein CesoFtcFv8_016428 [Champsocephalus esox]
MRALSNAGVCSGQLLLAKGLFVVRGVVVDAVTPLRVPPPRFLFALCFSPARLMLISRRNDPVTFCRAQGRGAKAAGGTANGRLPGWMTGSVSVRPADSQQGRTIGRLPS